MEDATVGTHENKNHESLAEMIKPSPILDIHELPIPLEWQIEFRGFFWGEGSMWIQGKSGSYAVRAAISLRSDDLEILKEFQKHLGGRIFIQSLLGTKTAARWQVSTKKDVERISQILITDLPFKKAKEVVIWKKAIQIRKDKMGRHWSPEQVSQMEKLAIELKALRAWTE